MKKSIKDIDIQNKCVLIRVDFNVPMDSSGNIIDATRIEASCPTIQYALDQNAKVILMSHLGRPKAGSKKESLRPCAKKLSELLHHDVLMADDVLGETVQKEVALLPKKGILLLENLRFYEGEQDPEKDPSFAKNLAGLADVYIDDAFGAAHRAHSSITEITKYVKEVGMGLLLEKEVSTLGKLLHTPERPFYAVIGGAKISTKIGVIEALLSKVDALFIGGAMAYTFLLQKGLPVGDSLVEKEMVPVVEKLLTIAKTKIFLPEDILIAQDATGKGLTTVPFQDGIPPGYSGMSSGEKTVSKWIQELQKAKTILWNGPLGVFENTLFQKPTFDFAKALSELSSTVVIGGGDVVAAVEQAGVAQKFSHISTGGGATLEFIEQGTLVGVEALDR